MSDIRDVVIIGCGPAGMSAAVYASRAKLDVVVLDSGAPGGKLLKTSDIENYIGNKKVDGVALAMQMFEHSTSFGAVYQYGNVVDIEDHGAIKRIILDDNSSIDAKSVIIATGTNDGLMNIKGEEEYTGKGVSYCAVCDAAFFKDKVVCVIGGGNSALEEALYLTKFASKVHVIIRRDVFRAEPIIQQRVMENPKIEIHKLLKPKEVVGNGMKVTKLVLESSIDGSLSEIDTDGIFPFIGAIPATAFAKKLGILNDKGYIVVNNKMETSVQGIYGVGDVCDKPLRQIVTATSDGAIAGQQVYHYLSNI